MKKWLISLGMLLIVVLSISVRQASASSDLRLNITSPASYPSVVYSGKELSVIVAVTSTYDLDKVEAEVEGHKTELEFGYVMDEPVNANP